VKPEGWHQLSALRGGFGPVSVEAGYGTGMADVTLQDGGARYDVELKTWNSNWQIPGVRNATRPITMNIAGMVTAAGQAPKAALEVIK
jgi:hypothetical protein